VIAEKLREPQCIICYKTIAANLIGSRRAGGGKRFRYSDARSSSTRIGSGNIKMSSDWQEGGGEKRHGIREKEWRRNEDRGRK